jgi:NADH:ubiquinone reductase (H+-translocating)
MTQDGLLRDPACREPTDGRAGAACSLAPPTRVRRDRPIGGVTHILIVGGGYVGLYTALGLQRQLRPGEARVTLVNPESFMLYQPFLPEAASGSIEPRHVVVPLRPLLRKVRLITGQVTAIDPKQRVATVAPTAGDPYELSYDHVVVAVGSVSRVLPIPGLAEHGVGFKSVSEAIYLRNRVLAAMDAAESTGDAEVRRRALTFVFVGAGYAGVEAMAELEDMARYATRFYRRFAPSDMRWVLVEASPRILPEMPEDLAGYVLRQLRERGFHAHLATRIEAVDERGVRLSNGLEYESDTIVWTAGVRAHPVLARYGMPLDRAGRIETDEFLRVRGMRGAWAAGDAAAIPDVVMGGLSPPTAQHALREARRLSSNLIASLRGEPQFAFRYRNLGALASLGLYKGVASVMGLKVRGFPAWFLHRSYHVSRVPTLNRKARVIVDWSVALLFRRDVVQLGSLQRPREQFIRASEASEARSDREPGAEQHQQGDPGPPGGPPAGEQDGGGDDVDGRGGDAGDRDG